VRLPSKYVTLNYFQDEAFGYWTQWSLFYPPDSAERKLLEGIRDERWLISIVHHNFKDSDALWTLLLSDDRAE